MLSGTGASRKDRMQFSTGTGHYMPPEETEGRSSQQCCGEVCLGRSIFVASNLFAVEGRTVPLSHLDLRMYLGGLICSGLSVDPNANLRDIERLVVRRWPRTQKREPQFSGAEFCATLW